MGVVVLEVKVLPYHVNWSHAVCVSMAVLLWLRVRWRVTTLSQPAVVRVVCGLVIFGVCDAVDPAVAVAGSNHVDAGSAVVEGEVEGDDAVAAYSIES